MEWLAQNWLWILFAVFFVGMHMFGHGGHGGHGGHDDQDGSAKPGVGSMNVGTARPKDVSKHEH